MPKVTIVQRDFSDFLYQRFIDAQVKSKARLSPSLLLSNESGINGDIREILGPNDWAKVCFDIPSAKVKSAELVFYVKGENTTQEEPLRLLINGHRMTHRQKPERMLTGGWDRARIPARYLIDGVNEIVFCGGGILYIDPGAGGQSSRSFDGGHTWHTNALGEEGEIQGEYLVRLRLKGFAPEGQLVSPVIDLLEATNSIAPRLELRHLRLRYEHDSPLGTKLNFEIRTGTTPAFSARHWTAWEADTRVSQPGRFAQWRATLSTAVANQTPALKSVSLEVDSVIQDKVPATMELLEVDQPDIVYSSYDFKYLAPHHRVDRLLKQYRLEEVVAAGKDELEKFALLRDWVHSQWLGWQSDKYPYCPSWDPLEILETTKGNWGYGMCTHYGATFTACAAALGYVARVLIVDHHCLAEVWSDQLQKWILQDPGPNREYDASYERRGIPVNALEFHQAHAAGKAHHLTINKLPQKTTAKMTNAWGGLFKRFGIPLRNNHLVEAEPAELFHGYSQYHWDGYLWWTVDVDPKYAEYSLQTLRPADFYWSVNQTRLYPQVSDEVGVLDIEIETATPNFSHYEVCIDAKDWERIEGPLRWSLHAGENDLAVRGVNTFGRSGRIARLQVRYCI